MATKSGIQAGPWSDLEATRWELSWGKGGEWFKPGVGAKWRSVKQGAQTGEGVWDQLGDWEKEPGPAG